MPTKNPRINLTVTPERYELLKRLSGFQGTSMSGLISETMEMVYPVLERVCVVLDAAKRAEVTSKEGLRDAVDKAEADLLPMLYQAVGQFDMFIDEAAKSIGAEIDSEGSSQALIRKIMSEGGSGVVGRREPAGGPINPRPVIRGSGSTEPSKNHPIPKPFKASSRGSKS